MCVAVGEGCVNALSVVSSCVDNHCMIPRMEHCTFTLSCINNHGVIPRMAGMEHCTFTPHTNKVSVNMSSANLYLEADPFDRLSRPRTGDGGDMAAGRVR